MRPSIKKILLFTMAAPLVMATAPKRRIIRTEWDTMEMDEQEIQELVRKRIKFMDITFGGELHTYFAPKPARMPLGFSEGRESLVRARLKNIQQERMKRYLVKLTSFRTRYYQSTTGRESAEWLFRIIKQITKGSPMKVTTRRVIHSGWPQVSVICRIESPADMDDDSLAAERVVLSAHLDSTSMIAPRLLAAPGADDDGSGVVTQLEVLRLLTRKAVRLVRPVEFMFFAAEEAGLLGSQAVARYYQESGIRAAVLHIDMDGYVAPGTTPGIGLITDNTDAGLNRLLRVIINKYSKLPVKETQCGYACSDHFSWHSAGYPAAALFEGDFEEMSPYIHTLRDTVDTINFEHMSEFVKVALAFALHMTDPDVDYE